MNEIIMNHPTIFISLIGILIASIILMIIGISGIITWFMENK